MRMALLSNFGLVVVLATTAAGQDGPRVVQHLEVYNEGGRFAGWPANNGIWSWDNEIVVGFTLGYHKEKSGHTIDPDRESGPRQARSLDGGLSWDLGYPRTVQRTDGNLITVYYFNDRTQVERYVAATIWSPGKRLVASPH